MRALTLVGDRDAAAEPCRGRKRRAAIATLRRHASHHRLVEFHKRGAHTLGDGASEPFGLPSLTASGARAANYARAIELLAVGVLLARATRTTSAVNCSALGIGVRAIIPGTDNDIVAA